jgi:protein gp37
MGKTSIQWTDRSWNCIRGCSPVSPGCKNCYAELIAARFSGPGQPFEGYAKWRLKSGYAPAGAVEQHDIPHASLPLFAPGSREPAWTGKVALIAHKLVEPLHWQSPSRVFVNSTSDLFHEGLTFAEIATVFAVMAASPRHCFQILTKRIERAHEFLEWMEMERQGDVTGRLADLYGLHVAHMRSPEEMYDDEKCPADDDLEEIYEAEWPLENVWLGASVENQRYADERIPVLLRCPAAKRFVSYEPALELVTFSRWLDPTADGGEALPCAECGSTSECGHEGEAGATTLDWIIVGGESGPGARAFDVEWARSVLRECTTANVKVFCKQMGAAPYDSSKMDGPALDARGLLDLRDKKGGDMEEWPESLRIREFPS